MMWKVSPLLSACDTHRTHNKIDKHQFSVKWERSRLASELSVADRLIAVHAGLQASVPSVADRLIIYTLADYPLNQVSLTD